MKIAVISTFPPRKCGIATFAKNLIEAIDLHQTKEDNCFVVAINNQENDYEYSDNVKFTIQQNMLADYIKAAHHINYSGAKVCLLQHEYGIFGGESGVFLLTLVNRLKIPLVVTFHTLLDKPSFMQLSIIQSLCKKAVAVVVMSQKGIKFLGDAFQVKDNIYKIEHGVPDIITDSKATVKNTFNLSDRKILLTFGLLSRNKGLETVIEALPRVIERHPEVLYIILGKTHPGVVKFEGESYRNKLKLLVKKLRVENHVHFFNEYLSEKQLFKYLAAADIYITPYLSKEQITSGTLAYALGAGACIISTPYWHAEELLSGGRGIIFPIQDHNKLSSLINDLLEDEDRASKMRESALAYSDHLKWPKIGKEYLNLLEQAAKRKVKKEQSTLIVDLSILPPFSLAHLKLLTDDTGMLQHAKYNIPDYKTGYCTDDNARALLAMTMAYHQRKQQDVLRLITRYLSFMFYMQREDGNFRNLLSYDRKFLDETGTEDAFGRAIWCLGYLVKYAPNAWMHTLAQKMFNKAEPQFKNLKSIRGLANTMIGLSYYLHKHSYDEQRMSLLLSLKKAMLETYRNNSDANWHWFENEVTYDNGILPLALFHYYEVINDEEVLEIATTSTNWLDSLVFKNDHLSLVGNQGWYHKGGELPMFDQQAIDAMAMTFLYYRAFNNTKNEKYLKRMFKTFLWFLGDNALGVPVYDHKSAGCYDGLEKKGINENQGAESTLAYFLSYFRILKAQHFEAELNLLKGTETASSEETTATV
jgi:glycosyltransferase involved in cell wall biosynthesis